MNISIQKAAEFLKRGLPVIFSTDTVWGLGIAVDYCKGPLILYEAKGRDALKPIAWLVDSQDALEKYGRNVPEYAFELAKKYWPGALTLVVEASDTVSTPYRSKTGTIGLRMPASEGVLELIGMIGCPIATTSANFSGCAATPATDNPACDFAKAAHVAILDLRDMDAATTSKTPTASTVVDCTSSKPKVLRQGEIAVLE